MICKIKVTHIIPLIIILLIFVNTSNATAHSIEVDVINQTIEIEAYYGDGKPVKNADVTVYDSDGEVYLTGKTDDVGKFKFEVTGVKSSRLTIKVEQTGHKAEVEVELGSSTKTSSNEELPVYQRALAGLGYIFGIAGMTSFYLARRLKHSFEQKQLAKEKNSEDNNLKLEKKTQKKVNR